MLPRNVYMSDTMPNRSSSHRGATVAAGRPYVDTVSATSASAVSIGRPSDISAYTLGGTAGCGSIQSGTTPGRRVGGVFNTFGKGFSTWKGGRSGIPSTSAPNLGDIWYYGWSYILAPHGDREINLACWPTSCLPSA